MPWNETHCQNMPTSSRTPVWLTYATTQVGDASEKAIKSYGTPGRDTRLLAHPATCMQALGLNNAADGTVLCSEPTRPHGMGSCKEGMQAAVFPHIPILRAEEGSRGTDARVERRTTKTPSPRTFIHIRELLWLKTWNAKKTAQGHTHPLAEIVASCARGLVTCCLHARTIVLSGVVRIGALHRLRMVVRQQQSRRAEQQWVQWVRNCRSQRRYPGRTLKELFLVPTGLGHPPKRAPKRRWSR